MKWFSYSKDFGILTRILKDLLPFLLHPLVPIFFKLYDYPSLHALSKAQTSLLKIFQQCKCTTSHNTSSIQLISSSEFQILSVRFQRISNILSCVSSRLFASALKKCPSQHHFAFNLHIYSKISYTHTVSTLDNFFQRHIFLNIICFFRVTPIYIP